MRPQQLPSCTVCATIQRFLYVFCPSFLSCACTMLLGEALLHPSWHTHISSSKRTSGLLHVSPHLCVGTARMSLCTTLHLCCCCSPLPTGTTHRSASPGHHPSCGPRSEPRANIPKKQHAPTHTTTTTANTNHDQHGYHTTSAAHWHRQSIRGAEYSAQAQRHQTLWLCSQTQTDSETT